MKKNSFVIYNTKFQINLLLVTTTLLLFGFKNKPFDNPKKPMNVIYILTDDHRFDFMGFTGKVPWLETPSMDRLAKEGVWIKNATVLHCRARHAQNFW